MLTRDTTSIDPITMERTASAVIGTLTNIGGSAGTEPIIGTITIAIITEITIGINAQLSRNATQSFEGCSQVARDAPAHARRRWFPGGKSRRICCRSWQRVPSDRPHKVPTLVLERRPIMQPPRPAHPLV